MSEVRTDKLQGIWGSGATAGADHACFSPVIGTAYRLTTADVTVGAQYLTKNPSEVFNQYLYTASKLLAELELRGILGWNSTTAYTVGAFALASDGKLYVCIQNGTNKDPVSQPSYWSLAIDNRALTTLSNITTSPIVANSTANTSPDVVIESWVASDGLSWYRLYKSGWVKQGGRTGEIGLDSSVLVTYPKAFTSNVCTLQVSRDNQNASDADPNEVSPCTSDYVD